MERMMGDHRPAAVARASGLGMVSSSCSYAATAMAKSLFAKGADFVDAMIFMFASTNLVIELGIVLSILMGWQFAVAEFVGGPIIAVVSFVCSVGNVPMAAALWKGGISFGGVISFLFADLITLPLLLIYRKYYGGRLTLRLLAWFWVVMAAAGLLVEGLFSLT